MPNHDPPRSSKVYQKAVNIIERFFGCDEEDEDDENLAPDISEDGNTFSFGVSTSAGVMHTDASSTPSKTPTCGLAVQGTPSGGGNVPTFGSPVRTLNFA